jgi:hypothetical protein
MAVVPLVRGEPFGVPVICRWATPPLPNEVSTDPSRL